MIMQALYIIKLDVYFINMKS